MDDTTDAWEHVSDRFEALALKLKMHAQEEWSDADLESKVGFDRVRTAVDEAMDAIQAAYEDEAVREDAREAGQAVVDAIDATIRTVQERLRQDT